MIAVITGDVIQSARSESPADQLTHLKHVLGTIGQYPSDWEIQRGDSFQLRIDFPAACIWKILVLKSGIKMHRKMDVRMAIGIGTQELEMEEVSQSNGEAYVYSGHTLDQLKKVKQNLMIKSPWPDLDQYINLYFELASVIMDSWTNEVAKFVNLYLKNTNRSQKEIGEILGISQPSVSDLYKRSKIKSLLKMEKMFRERILVLCE